MPGAGSLRVGGAEVAPSLGAREVASASAYLRGGGVDGKVQPTVSRRAIMVSTAASQREGPGF